MAGKFSKGVRASLLAAACVITVLGCSLFQDTNSIHLQDGRYEGPGIGLNIFDDAISQDGSTFYYGYCLVISLDPYMQDPSSGRMFYYGGESFHHVPIEYDRFSVDVYGCMVEGRVTSPTTLEGSLSYNSESTGLVQRDWTVELVEAR